MSAETFDWKALDGTTLRGYYWAGEAKQDGALIEGPPFVLIHGLGEHSGRYHRLAADLNAGGHSVYSFDLRGHGVTEGPRGDTPSFQLLVEDVLQFLDVISLRKKKLEAGETLEAGGVVRPILVAHSLGGTIATKFAFQYPDRIQQLILISPYFKAAFEPQWWRLALGRIFYYLWPSFSLNVGLQLQHLSADIEVQQAISDDPLSHQRLSARWAIQAIKAGQFLLDNPERLKVPTDVLHAGPDKITSAKASRQFVENQRRLGAQTCPEIRYFEFAEGYHQIHNDSLTRDQVLSCLLGREVMIS